MYSAQNASKNGVNVQIVISQIEKSSQALKDQQYDECEANIEVTRLSLACAIKTHQDKSLEHKKIRCPGCKRIFDVEIQQRPHQIKCKFCGRTGIIK